jgi:hypothetical protein
MPNVARSLLAGAGLVSCVLVAGPPWLGCRPDSATLPPPELAILQRKVQALERLSAPGRGAPPVPFDQGLITVDQSLLQSLTVAALPYEAVAGDRFRIRIQDAKVQCEDGVALVKLHGRASLSDRPEQDASVEANVYGAIEGFDLDPALGVLRGRVKVIAFETPRARLFGSESMTVKGLVHDMARLRIEAFGDVGYEFEIPVRIVQDIVIPELGPEGGVHIPETKIPLAVFVSDVTALRGKLWISFHLMGSPGESGAPAEPVRADSSARDSASGKELRR